MTARPPIIIVGMHRSGTSLVTRLLEQLGLFVGCEKDENNESLFFQELNDWILCQAGATWDNPLATEWLIEEKKGCDLIAEFLESILKSPNSRSFFGRWRHIRFRARFWYQNSMGVERPAQYVHLAALAQPVSRCKDRSCPSPRRRRRPKSEAPERQNPPRHASHLPEVGPCQKYATSWHTSRRISTMSDPRRRFLPMGRVYDCSRPPY